MFTSLRLSVLLGALSFLYLWFWREPSTPPWDPQTPLPFPEAHYAQAAGCVQQTYCPSSNIVGLEVGDAQLLWTVGDSDAHQRVNVYRSPSLGLVVAYAGTNVTSKTSMAINNDYLLDKADPLLALPARAKVEGGAQKAWKLHWDQVLEAVQREDAHEPDGRITVTGHSMGAQLAILASVALERLYKERVYVLTCESSRGRTFAKAYQYAHSHCALSSSSFSFLPRQSVSQEWATASLQTTWIPSSSRMPPSRPPAPPLTSPTSPTGTTTRLASRPRFSGIAIFPGRSSSSLPTLPPTGCCRARRTRLGLPASGGLGMTILITGARSWALRWGISMLVPLEWEIDFREGRPWLRPEAFVDREKCKRGSSS